MIGVNASEWEGLDSLAEDELEALRPKAERVMWDAGMRFQSALKQKLSGSRTGRTYKVSKTGALHVASAPGEPPAVLFGALRNSMGFGRPKWRGLTLEMEVGSGLGVGRDTGPGEADTYSRRLEFGGISFHPWPVKIEARPYMEPVSVAMDPVIQRLFKAGL